MCASGLVLHGHFPVERFIARSTACWLSIHSVWTLVCTAQRRQRPRPISKVSSPKLKKKHLLIIWEKFTNFGFWKVSKLVLRQLKVAALAPWTLSCDEYRLLYSCQCAPIRVNEQINDCFVLPLRGRRATRARSDDLLLICSPQEAMRDMCARRKTFVHATQWSSNLSLIFTETKKNTSVLQMDDTRFLLL